MGAKQHPAGGSPLLWAAAGPHIGSLNPAQKYALIGEIVVAHPWQVSIQLLGDVFKATSVGLGAGQPGTEAVLCEKMLKSPGLIEGGFGKWV